MKCPLHPNAPDGRELQLVSTRMREGEGRIVRCPDCGLVMQDLVWDADKVQTYYNKDYRQTNSLVEGKVLTAKEHFEERITTIDPLFQEVKPFLRRSMNVLEVGCGAGELLSVIRPHVKRCVGIEMTKDFTDYIEAELHIEARAGDLLKMDWGEETFDLIICVDSLDHMPNPLEVLIKMRSLLAPAGSIWITVPNLDDSLNTFLPEPNRAKFREFYWHRAHFFYFNAKTLAALLKAAGFNLRNTTYYHQYTLKNFLQWYFMGSPQKSYVEAGTGVSLLAGSDPFVQDMNKVFAEANTRFRDILRKRGRGDTLCAHAVPIRAEKAFTAMRNPKRKRAIDVSR